NCWDYRSQTRYTSRENCLNQCLYQFTNVYGMVIESHFLNRELFENSSLILAPWKLTMPSNNMRRFGNTTYTSDFLTKFPNHLKECKSYCSRQDCFTQSFTPCVIEMSNDRERLNRSNPKQYAEIYTTIYPPNQVLVVEANKKLSAIDLIVYILSSFSFWYGLCPLDVVRIIRKPFSKDKKKKGTKKELVFRRSRGRQHTKKSVIRKKESSRWLSAFVCAIYGLAVIGFTYQAAEVCNQYFKYETVTDVTLDSLETTTVPKLVLPQENQFLSVDYNGYTVNEVFLGANVTTE